MGLFDKLMFWKKEAKLPGLDAPPELPRIPELGKPHELRPGPSEMPPSLGIPDRSAPEFGVPSEEPSDLGFPSREFKAPKMPGFEEPSAPAFAHRSFEPPAPAGVDRLETISAKIDTIKAQLDSVLQRLEHLEQISKEERLYRQRWH